ncbi:MAG TPA: protein translocase subunit SecF [Candidatus Limnocylindrales bacterium]
MFDLIGKRRWFYLISLAITIPGFIFILLTPLTGGKVGLQFSIDFTGGTVWEIHFANGTPSSADVQAIMASQGLPGTAAIATVGDKSYVLIRTEQIGLAEFQPSPSPGASSSPAASSSPSDTASPAASGSPAASSSSAASSVAPEASTSPEPSASPEPSTSPAPSASAGAVVGASPSPSASPGTGGSALNLPTTGKLADLRYALEDQFGPIDEVSQEANIGPIISNEIAQQALLLIVLGSIGILAWVTFRFQDFRMGATAIAALIHDVLVVVGTFAIAGTFFGLQVDALFVTAMLTVIGFSVHDTIVVYDRIRENRIRHAGEPFDAIVNHSLLQTVGRSLNTSLTTILVLTALLLFGSDATRAFVFAMVIGIVSGTYSSIFNASSLLVDWHLWDDRKRAREFAVARGR